jgi:hypothetical protein
VVVILKILFWQKVRDEKKEAKMMKSVEGRRGSAAGVAWRDSPTAKSRGKQLSPRELPGGAHPPAPLSSPGSSLLADTLPLPPRPSFAHLPPQPLTAVPLIRAARRRSYDD